MLTRTLAVLFLLTTLGGSARAGQVYAWGFNKFGAIGDGTTTDRLSPVPVKNLGDVAAITAGKLHSLALLPNGTVRAWGNNDSGALGDGTKLVRTTPVAVNTLSNVTAIAAGAFHSLALSSDGTVRSWGYNFYGELGDGTKVTRSSPVAVSSLSGVTAVAAGADFSLALRSDGTAAAWGYNSYGNLGTSAGDKTTPTTTFTLTGATAIAVGQYHSMAIVSDQTVRAWGDNSSGQLGVDPGFAYEVRTPEPTLGLAGVTAIAAGYGFSLALLSDGTVRSWGNNFLGQLGDGTTINHFTPLAVPGLSNIVAIEGIQDAGFALSADGRLWSWGGNSYGQLGLGDTVDRLLPTEVHAPNGFRFTAIAGDSFSNHVLALVVPVPEPSSFVLAALGLIGLAVWGKRRTRSMAALAIVVVLGLAHSDARAVTIDTVPVGNVGNANDPLTGNLFGGVSYAYRIGTTEVTNAQYAAFLNEKAKSDPLALYNTNMGSNARGGIAQSGVSGSFTYATKTDMGNKPVNYVSWYDAIRFANWLNNGQGAGDTETGAYTLVGGTPIPSNGLTFTRNIGATWFMTSENEWYKAAYHQPAVQGGDVDNYWLYPTRSNNVPTIATANSVGDISNPGANVANYDNGADWNSLNGNVATVGTAGPLSQGFYGTADQGGNVWEWNEADISGFRGLRGGSYHNLAGILQSSYRQSSQSGGSDDIGFRVATVPEPSSCVLAALGIIGLVTWKRRSRNFVLALCAVGALSSARISEAGTIVKFDFTNFGSVQVELFDSDAPLTVANFLTRYATVNRYTDTMIHRVDTVLGVVQGGGFTKAAIPVATAADPMIPLEYLHPNTRGTLAMVRLAGPNTATSQWYFNTVNNTNTLGPSNAGGYAVFGQVLGNGMEVIDAIAAVPTFTYTTPFGMVPLQNFTIADFNNNVDPLPHVVVLKSVTIVPEPSSFVLAALGLIGLVVWRLRR